MNQSLDSATTSSARRILTAQVVGLVILGCGVVFFAALAAPSVPKWIARLRNVPRQGTIQRENILFPLALTPEEREARLEKEYHRLTEQVRRLNSYRHTLEDYLTNERIPGVRGEASKQQLRLVEDVLDRVGWHSHELQAERDAVYKAWRESKNE